jgi:precorrin-6B methylase 2
MMILLDALAALGLVLKVEQRYETAPDASPLLAADGEKTILPMILHAVTLWERWSHLTDVVRIGKDQRMDEASALAEPEALKAFIGAMHVAGAPMAEAIVAALAPIKAGSLLDIGGGPATYTLAFLRAVPQLKVTYFDQPAVVELARARLEQASMLHRVSLVAGDFYHDELPGGHDFAFLSAIMHQNSPEQNLALYRKIHRALNPGGRLVIRDHIMQPDRLHPRAGALFAVNMLVATEGGGTYTFAEMKADLLGAGFERIRLLQEGERMDGLLEAFK